jgi:hypothetical protein
VERTARAALVACISLGLIASVTTAATAASKAAKGGPQIPRFIEEAAPAGIDHTYDGSWEFFTGGGVAVFDCDDDGRPDLYLAGGAEPAALYRNESPTGGALAFSQVDGGTTALTEVTGAYPIDIDGDRRVDLAVLRRAENVLFRGLGECRFERANEAWSFDGDDDWTVGFSAKWDPGATLPTLAFGDYLTIVEPGLLPACDESAVFRPVPGGHYGEAESLNPGYCSLSVLFSDWDRSGRRDLRVTNDLQYYAGGEDQLWRVMPGEAATAWTRKEGWQPLNVFGMGIASHDLTGDGYPEYFISSMADNKLQALADGPERPTYRDIAHKRNATLTRPFAGGDLLPSTAWHAEFDDVNNDGNIDLFVAKGNVETMPDHAQNDPNNLLLGRGDGKFKEGAKGAGILSYARSRGAALADLNLDGMLDLVEVNRTVPVKLWRNLGAGKPAKPRAMGNWLAIELAQDDPNVDAIGSWIEVRAGKNESRREVTIGGGHASGQLGPIHFGMGAAKTADVRVTWPDGEDSEWMPVTANERVRVDRGTAEPFVLEPPLE